MAPTNTTGGMLDGVVVLDLTSGAGRLCGSFLASLGARVLRPMAVGEPAEDDVRSWYENAGKELWTAASMDAVVSALDRCDVALADDTTDERWGLSLDRLRSLESGAIVCAITPYGLDGPVAGVPSTELTLQAASGQMWTIGDPDRAPLPLPGSQTSYQASIRGALAVMAALYSRLHGAPGGDFIDVSRQEAMCNSMSGSKDWWYVAQQNLLRGSGGDEVARRIVWEAADGWVCWRLSLGLGIGRNRDAVIQWMREEGAAGELADVPFDRLSALDVTREQMERWEALFDAFFRPKTRAELFAAARERGFMMVPVLSLAELADDAHVRAHGSYQRVGEGDRVFDIPTFPIVADGVDRERRAPRALGSGPDLPPTRRAGEERASGAPLDGVKIVDFGWALAGPQTTRLLGMLGATVVKVETNTRLDATRASTPFVGRPSRNRSGAFAMHNNNKLGITLDLTKAESRPVFERLVRWADAVTENFSGQRFEAWGLGYDVLSGWNPGLVMVRSSTWGQHGPYAKVPGYGLSLGAFSGYADLIGWPDRDPTPPGIYTDMVSPGFAAGVLVAALIQRERTGHGVEIDLSQLECSLNFIGPEIASASLGNPPGRHGPVQFTPFPSAVFRCLGEQEWCAVAVETREQWAALCAQVPGLSGMEALTDEALGAVAPFVAAELAAHCATEPAASLVEELRAAGVPAAKVATPQDLFSDPQLAHRGHFVELEHPSMERFAYEMPSFRYRDRTVTVSRSPLIGEHNGEVFGDALGYSADEIAELYAMGVLN